MNYQQWMSLSKRGVMTPRSKALKAVDKALQAYDRTPTLQAIHLLDDAILDWMATKDDWRNSVRSDAMVKLIAWVRKMQGFTGGVAPANYAPSVIHRRLPREHLVSIAASQTLTYPPSYQAYCDQWFGGNRVVPFPMTVNFGIMRYGTTVIVNVRALGEVGNHAVEDNVLSNWKTHCESAWNCATLFVGRRKYELRFNLIWVKPGAPGPYYTVKVHQPPPLANLNATREEVAEHHRSGTPHLAQWGVEDRQAILHEFGHMIGNPDEYFCTGFTGLAGAFNGLTYNKTPFTTDSIMNNTNRHGLKIYERHFAQTRLAFMQFLETVEPRPLPPVSIRIEKPARSPAAVHHFMISQAMHKRRRAMGY